MPNPIPPTDPENKPPKAAGADPAPKPAQPSHAAGSGSTTGDPRPQGDRSSQSKQPL